MNAFDDIRPYHDHEVRGVLDRLLADSNFLDLMARFKAPRLAAWLPFLARPWARAHLKSRFGQVNTVAQLQQAIAADVERVVAKTTRELTFSGLDALTPETSYLFFSNHRDIVFDPALVNLALYRAGFDTVRIAIGDNLLKSRLVAELMRLNKSFVVKRGLSSPREMRDNFMTLSAYINQSLQEGHSIWIAQQEGRAKDGRDRTDPAIVKMFYMSPKRAGLGFAEAIRGLRIVPVAISYEYDPCDLVKAKELEEKARTGTYVKAENEDIASIVSGIQGDKGRVHVAFGTPLTGDFQDARDVAQAVDRQILGNYRLFPSNYLAYRLLRQEHPELELPPVAEPDAAELDAARPVFEQRLAQCPAHLRRYVLEMYANPVIGKMQVTREQLAQEA